MIDSIREFLLQLFEILPNIGILLFFCGLVDNYFLTRYGGKLNRGFMVWSEPLRGEEKQFLTNLNTDIVDRKYIGQLIKRSQTSFIAVDNREVLIRFHNPSQGTSWPMVGYVDLSSPDLKLEYRLSLLMLVAAILISLMFWIVLLVLVVGFLISWLSETRGIRNYLSQKTDFYLVRKDTHFQKGGS